MSIRITQNNCVGCGRCIEACPGNLIKKDAQGKAVIKHISDCWGCTSCLKECKTGAISFYLGADMGGADSVLPAPPISGSRYGRCRKYAVCQVQRGHS